MRKQILAAISSSILLVLCTGCPFFPSAPPTGYVKTDDITVDPITKRWLSYKVRPYQAIAGNWQVDLVDPKPVGNVYNFGVFEREASDERGEFSLVNARLNAGWNFAIAFDPPCWDNVHYDPIKEIDTYNGDYTWLATGDQQTAVIACEFYSLPSGGSGNIAQSQFRLNNPYPATLTVIPTKAVGSGSLPTLLLYNQTSDTPYTRATATSVAGNGTSVTFAFPRQSNGSAIASDIYNYSVIDNSGAYPANAGGSTLVLGDSDTTTYSTPFGVDALSYTEAGLICYAGTGGKKGRCDTVNTHTHYPIVTEYNLGQVKFNGSTLSVGTHPTIVRAYKMQTSTHTDPYGGAVRISQQANALVVNTGNNTISILNLITSSTAATITVGSQPVHARISSDNTKAYVVNYGSGTVSVVSLASNVVTNTINIGGHPTTITLDSNGNAFVGNSGSITEINLSSLAVTSTQTVSGTVTGLGFSAGTSQLLSSVGPTSTSSTIGAVSYKPSSGFTQAETVPAHSSSFNDYSSSALTSELLWPSQLANGVSISSTYANNYAISVSGSLFTVTQLSSGATWVQGVLPAAIRGLAVESGDTYAYLTVPDQNMLVTIPIPSPPATPTTPIITP